MKYQEADIMVYLAGGFHSGWQDLVRKRTGSSAFGYFDPSRQHLNRPEQYTAWDLMAIRNCDVVLAYLESDNPGGYNLALEIGYAYAMGKVIILVDEKGGYTAMLHECSIVCDDINQAVNLLIDMRPR